ncbi:MAG: DUF1761 domain-containing protein [Bacteroidetes bacterium]|nr:DUF1761 domain-containing protein [Bacteroidota bacterium]
MDMKFYLVFVTALIPLLVGMVYYNRSVLGNAWMQASGMTEEKGKSMNMILIFVLTYIFGLMASVALSSIVIHQIGVFSVLNGDESAEAKAFLKNFMDTYGPRFRTFKHGVLHGVIAALFIALPVVGVGAMFEAKGWKYIAIHVGYWVITFALIGGVLCQFV